MAYIFRQCEEEKSTASVIQSQKNASLLEKKIGQCSPNVAHSVVLFDTEVDPRFIAAVFSVVCSVAVSPAWRRGRSRTSRRVWASRCVPAGRSRAHHLQPDRLGLGSPRPGKPERERRHAQTSRRDRQATAARCRRNAATERAAAAETD